MPDANASSSRSFGKRGAVTMPAAPKKLLGTPGDGLGDGAAGSLGFPKWAIGAVAGLFLMALVATGGGLGGGGLLGGLLGGFLAHKFLGGSSSQSAQARPPVAGSPTTQTANESVARGGFGSSSAFFGRSGG